MPEPDTTPPADLRQRIADTIRAAACPGDCGQTEEECTATRIQPVVWHHGVLAAIEATPEQIADALLPLVAAEVRAAAADLRTDHPDMTTDAGRYRAGILRAATRLAARADQMEQQ